MTATRRFAALVLLASTAGRAAEAGQFRVLYFSQTVGGRHATIDVGRDVLRKLGEEAGAFTLDECTDCRKWSADYLAPYAAIVSFGGGTLPLSEANRAALLGTIRGGRGFVGIHSAVQMLPNPKWPEYWEMLGGAYAGALWEKGVRIIVEDRLHPATRHLGAAFTITDEIYQFIPWERGKTHVLLSVDNRSVNVFQRNVRRKDRDFAVAWCHPYGKGRVFYTCLGHGKPMWQLASYQAHLLNAIQWAAGRVDAKIPLGSDGRVHEVRRPETPRPSAVASMRPSAPLPLACKH